MKREKYINKKYNKLIILSIIKNDYDINKTKVLCKCDCGNEKVIYLGNVIRGLTKSCGCIRKKNGYKQGTNKKTHGQSKTKLYRVYKNVINRCYNKNHDHYKHYGGRNIKMCDEWLNDFMSFYNWAYDNGYTDMLTIDRIDNNGNYEPNNCRWVDMSVQSNNKRNTVYLTYNNKTQSMKQWANELGLNYEHFRYRIRNKSMSIDEAIADLKRSK